MIAPLCPAKNQIRIRIGTPKGMCNKCFIVQLPNYPEAFGALSFEYPEIDFRLAWLARGQGRFTGTSSRIVAGDPSRHKIRSANRMASSRSCKTKSTKARPEACILFNRSIILSRLLRSRLAKGSSSIRNVSDAKRERRKHAFAAVRHCTGKDSGRREAARGWYRLPGRIICLFAVIEKFLSVLGEAWRSHQESSTVAKTPNNPEKIPYRCLRGVPLIDKNPPSGSCVQTGKKVHQRALATAIRPRTTRNSPALASNVIP